jgi:hypothetical protein
MKRDFPLVRVHSEAACFKCGGVLSSHRPSGNARGRGEHRGQCDTCGVGTWYDVDPNAKRRVARADRKCNLCGSVIPAGSTYRHYRERALSSAEACYAGTLYPVRCGCLPCMEARDARAQAAYDAELAERRRYKWWK